ncbi:MAG TPA: hypothetical protein VKV95_01605 [Terriglobia bacterium]|nr:hypothetical protein [Terriglobia bacterium]
MRVFIYKPRKADFQSFLDFWSRQYDSGRYQEKIYSRNIGKRKPEAIRALFQWKNAGPLSEKKKKSVEANYISCLGELRAYGSGPFREDFLMHFFSKFSKGGAVWRVFWLHCCYPKDFPMFDQHVFRAHMFILGSKVPELDDLTDKEKVMCYIYSYLPFYRGLARFNDKREVDKALWSFGRFIKQWPHFGSLANNLK